jgi:hypothetical protein
LYVMHARNHKGSVRICDAYSRCYVAPAAYASTVTSHSNRKGYAGCIPCGSALRLYESTDRTHFREWVQYSLEFCCVVLTSWQRKLKICYQETSSEKLQRNSHCWEPLPSKD